MPNRKLRRFIISLVFFLINFNTYCQLNLPGMFSPNVRYSAEMLYGKNSTTKLGYRESGLQATIPVHSKLGLAFDASKLWEGGLWKSLKNLDKNAAEAFDVKASQVFVTGNIQVRNPTYDFHYENERTTILQEHQYYGNIGLAGLYQTKGLRFNFWNVNFAYNTLPAIQKADIFSIRAMFVHAKIKNMRNIIYYGAFARYANIQGYMITPIFGYYGNIFGKISYGFTLPVEAFFQYRFNKKYAIGTNIYLHGFNIFDVNETCTYDSTQQTTICVENGTIKLRNNTTLRLGLIGRINIGKRTRITPQIGIIPFWINHFYRENQEFYKGVYGRFTLSYSFGNALLRPEFIPVLGE